MKYILSLLLLVFLAFSSSITYADFFNEYVMGDDPEIVMIQDIKLTYVSFNENKEKARFNNTSYFITNIKNEAMDRYSGGMIPLYRMHDIITNLDSFVYEMNQYFSYQKKYEQTRVGIYKENAQSYLEDAR